MSGILSESKVRSALVSVCLTSRAGLCQYGSVAFAPFWPPMDILDSAETSSEQFRAIEPTTESVHELKADEILEVCRRSKTIRLKPGEFLFREGDEARFLYVVRSGTVRVMSGSTVYETIKAGGIVGEMAIIDRYVPRSASAIAGTHAELAAIDASQFLSLVAETPSFALTVMQVVTRRLRVMNQRFRTGR